MLKSRCGADTVLGRGPHETNTFLKCPSAWVSSDSPAVKSPPEQSGKLRQELGSRKKERLPSKTCESKVHSCSQHCSAPSAQHSLKSTLLSTESKCQPETSAVSKGPPCPHAPKRDCKSMRQEEIGPIPTSMLTSQAQSRHPGPPAWARSRAKTLGARIRPKNA